MYEAELMATATGAAGTLVAAIATWGAENARAKVVRFFRRGGQDQQRAAVQAVDDTVARLASPDPGAQALSVSLWAQLFAQYLAEHREAAAELDELTAVGTAAVKVVNQHNTGAGTFIGGDVHGGITLHQGGAPDGRH
ncbi:hypothetical protein P8605_11555 [Streptomyces sp. T-3]|nr:hypothetical protein [Streptomyces sp. T-3]